MSMESALGKLRVYAADSIAVRMERKEAGELVDYVDRLTLWAIAHAVHPETCTIWVEVDDVSGVCLADGTCSCGLAELIVGEPVAARV